MFAATLTGAWLLTASLQMGPALNRNGEAEVASQRREAVRLPFFGTHRRAGIMNYRGYYPINRQSRTRPLRRHVPPTGLRVYGVPFYVMPRGRFDRWR